MFAGLHDFSVTTPGLTSVQYPVLVLAAELQNRSAFSHRITPLQLLTNVLPEICSCPLYGPGTRLSPPDSEM